MKHCQPFVLGISFLSIFLLSLCLSLESHAKASVETAKPVKTATAGLVAAASPHVALPTDKSASAIETIFNEVVKNYDPSPSTEIAKSPSPRGTLLDDRSMWRSLGGMLISLALVILLVLVIAWVMKKYVVKKHNLGGGRIELIASYTLSQKSKVHLLRVGEQHYLVGEGANTLALISEVELPGPLMNESPGNDEPAYAAGGNVRLSSSFGKKLSQWQEALQSKDIQGEVRTSLLLLGGLAQRLRKKRENQDETP